MVVTSMGRFKRTRCEIGRYACELSTVAGSIRPASFAAVARGSTCPSNLNRVDSAVALPTAKIANPDISRLINSAEIQAVVRPAKPKTQKRPWTQKKNPLKNRNVLFRLNPYAKVLRKQELGERPLNLERDDDA